MLFREIIAAYFETYVEYTHTCRVIVAYFRNLLLALRIAAVVKEF